MDLARQLSQCYGLHDVELRDLGTLVNDVLAVTAREGDFALKLYHTQRTRPAVQWEADLVLRLQERGAPVAAPVRGRGGHVCHLRAGGQRRVAVLFPWAPGNKPVASSETYDLLGKAAARVHRAADGISPSPERESYDASTLVDDQLRRMRPLLRQAGQERSVVALGERLKRRLVDPALDWGICHLDLTLDNVHVDPRANVHVEPRANVHVDKGDDVQRGEHLTVFDFDSAGTCWRAIEPYGVLRLSEDYFQDWLGGYRSVRTFSRADEAAVATFAVVADLRVVAWKLGVAASSRGEPLLTAADLPAIVDGWLAWEQGWRPDC